jgi:hypothetical protein
MKEQDQRQEEGIADIQGGRPGESFIGDQHVEQEDINRTIKRSYGSTDYEAPPTAR